MVTLTVSKAELSQQVDESIIECINGQCLLLIGLLSGVIILIVQNKGFDDKSYHRCGNSAALSNDQSKKSCFDQNGRFIG
jgi:hypothetical protein